VGGKPYTPINTFKKWDSNSICDVTGFKRKLSEQVERWEGFMVIPEAWNVRQPQDFPVIPTPQTVYKKARSEQEILSPVVSEEKTIVSTWSELGFSAAWRLDDADTPLLPSLGVDNMNAFINTAYKAPITGYSYLGVDLNGGPSGMTPQSAQYFTMSADGELSFSCLLQVDDNVIGDKFILVINNTPLELRIQNGFFKVQNAGAGVLDTGIEAAVGEVYKICVQVSVIDDVIEAYINDSYWSQTSAGVTKPTDPVDAFIGTQNFSGLNDVKGVMALVGTKPERLSSTQVAKLFAQMDSGDTTGAFSII